jgi:hypothetical protein
VTEVRKELSQEEQQKQNSGIKQSRQRSQEDRTQTGSGSPRQKYERQMFLEGVTLQHPLDSQT